MTLELLAAGWRRRWWTAATASVAASALLGWVIGGAVLAIVLVAAAVTVWWLRRPRVDARVVARHLNRERPELHESAELLIADPSNLSVIERLQRERVRIAFEGMPHAALPHRSLRVGLTYSAIAAVGAIVIQLSSPSRGCLTPCPPLRDAERGNARELQLGRVETEIHPPAYTGRVVRRGNDWDLDAEAGSLVHWRIGASPAAVGNLVTSGGDTVRLAAATDGSLTAQLEVERSTLYFVTIHDSTGRVVTGDFHQLTVIPDLPPTVTVVSPELRTSIAAGAPSAVPLKVLVGDDYGISGTRLVATLTTGQGEGVKFREQELEFERTSVRPDRRPGNLLERTLDPRVLGLGPGDELYFYVIARDNRQPQPNETRSETYFITLADTAAMLAADFTGIAVNLVPEYFRSQRQIIIDTEKLLAERSKIDHTTFTNRSENIGLDQHLLRLRYGEIVGDEIVEGNADPGARHEHDIEDNATRLAPQVKATLQASLAQMWEAELRLRTSDPQGALPFEYRALELLKEVQQAARVYVRRVGFEPPPLEPDRKRLTGDLTKILRPQVARDVSERDSLPGVRAGLAVVRRMSAGGPVARSDAAALERAGTEMAALAVSQPGRHLEALTRLRTLIDSVAAGAGCAACLPAVEADFLRALPAPTPAASGVAPGSVVARTYFDLLRAP